MAEIQTAEPNRYDLSGKHIHIVNAAAKMHRLAGAKIHQRRGQEGPQTGGLVFRDQAWGGLCGGVSAPMRRERRLL